MTRRYNLDLFAVIASSIALLSGTSAQAQMPPSTMPLVINQPGVYVLNRDIRVGSGDAITINASNVTLDLNGRAVSTTSAGTGRGVFVNGGSGVVVKNGKVGSFNINVQADNATNLKVDHLQIVGANLPLPNPPGPPPAEIGILLVSVRGAKITNNLITGVGLGIFVRGPISGGNRISENTLVGGPDTSRSLLGMCWNPLPGMPGDAPGPKGDLVYNNHVAQFMTGISFSAGTTGCIAKENTIVFTSAAFSPTTPGASNLVEGNTTIMVAP